MDTHVVDDAVEGPQQQNPLCPAMCVAADKSETTKQKFFEKNK